MQIATNLMIDALLECVRAAGSAITTIYAAAAEGVNCELGDKADGAGPLTLADIAAHRILCDGLHQINGAISVVSEEDYNTHTLRREDGQFWLIDPLDGTKEFNARTGEFTVNVALVENGYPTIGVVYAPVLKELFWNVPGKGAFKDDGRQVRRIHTADVPTNAVLRVVASRSHLDEATRAFITNLGAHSLIQAGSSLKFCRVAEGSADVYPRFGPTCEWDVAAAQAILEAAGGHVCTTDGLRLRHAKTSIVNQAFIACSAALYDSDTSSLSARLRAQDYSA